MILFPRFIIIEFIIVLTVLKYKKHIILYCQYIISFIVNYGVPLGPSCHTHNSRQRKHEITMLKSLNYETTMMKSRNTKTMLVELDTAQNICRKSMVSLCLFNQVSQFYLLKKYMTLIWWPVPAISNPREIWSFYQSWNVGGNLQTCMIFCQNRTKCRGERINLDIL
jgi:hypothetical protein